MYLKRGVKSSESKNVPPVWKDTSFVLWAFPIAGYLTALCFDIGYLSYYGVPIAYAELNFYSVAISTVLLVFVLSVCFFAFLGVLAIKETDSVILHILFDEYSALIAILIFFMLYIANDPCVWALYFYGVLNIIRLILVLFDRSGKPFKERIKLDFITDESKPAETKGTKSYGKLFGKFTMQSFGFLLVLIIIHAAGYKAAGMQFWSVACHENSVLIPRNNNLYIEKKYDPKTLVLSNQFSVFTLSENDLEITQLKIRKLFTEHAYQLNKNEESRRNEREKEFKKFFEFVSQFPK